jgi:hypothetical protein
LEAGGIGLGDDTGDDSETEARSSDRFSRLWGRFNEISFGRNLRAKLVEASKIF